MNGCASAGDSLEGKEERACDVHADGHRLSHSLCAAFQELCSAQRLVDCLLGLAPAQRLVDCLPGTGLCSETGGVLSSTGLSTETGGVSSWDRSLPREWWSVFPGLASFQRLVNCLPIISWSLFFFLVFVPVVS